jgi:hypothetical protein
MKMRLLILLCAVVGLSSLAVNKSVAGNVSFSISVFDGPLGNCGHWVDRPGYGRCWHPAYVSSDWRPYCECYWLWTDGGWYWVSDEQWAWATYHYGRWVDDPYYGWVWVPDTEWAPSWVSWREGDGYVGWAPLPPGASFGPRGYLEFREEALPPRAFVFVEVGHFAEPIHRRAVIVNNVTIINKTVNITKITRVNNVVVNNGPKVEAMEKVSSRKLTVAPVRVAVEHRGVEPSRETPPRTLKPSSDGPSHQPANEEKAGKREPEIIRGGADTSRQPPEPKGEPERKEPEKLRVVPQPTEKEPPREKREESRQEERKDEKDRKGEPGGNQ